MSATVLWLRSDLRLDDNPALAAAVRRGGAVVPLFVWSPAEEGAWAPGAASRWWLDGSLRSLDAALRSRGSRLVVRSGNALAVLRDVVRETGAGAVVWSRRYEPSSVARDTAVKKALRDDGVDVDSVCSSLLVEPWESTKDDGSPYRVFTPFWKALLRRVRVGDATSAPARLPSPESWPRSEAIDDLALLPAIDWAGGMRAAWTPGEAAARATLARFVKVALASYETRRDLPATDGTSRLSPYLHFGEIGPRTAWRAVRDAAGASDSPAMQAAAEGWLRQIAWREFGHHLLFHFPATTDEPLRPEFARLRWNENGEWLGAWQKGRTGYPLVDAGMRQLWATGWMHNRVRMIAASFLVKDLRIAWQQGARWFWDTLVDADLANNTLGWQWTAGCGADAAPYYRVFNPVLQSRRFDARGEYLRRWLPELARLDDRWIHEPHAAPVAVLRAAGIEPGRDYPEPIVAHDRARRLALEAYEEIS